MAQNVIEPTQYLVDADGHRTAVVLPIAAWERLRLQVAAMALPDAKELAVVPGWSDIVTISAEVLSGEPVFANTRVPVQALIDYVRAGDSIESFQENYPSVPKALLARAIQLFIGIAQQ